MLLASCGGQSSSAYESSELSSSEESSSSKTTATSTSPATEWTDEEKEIITGVLGVEIPTFGISEYEFDSSVEEEYFEAYGLAGETDISKISSALSQLGFATVLYEEGNGLEGSKYAEDYSYAYIAIEFDDSEGETTVDIYGAYFHSTPEWPAEEIAAAAELTGLTDGIPAFEGATAYVHYVGSYWGLIYYSTIECYGVSREESETYVDTLTAAGYVYDAEYESYVLGGIEIYFEYSEGVFYITAYNLGEEEEESTPGEDWGDIWVAPETGSGVFNFEDETQITKKDAEQSIWTAEGVTFTVDKGESTVSVGNPTPEKSFYSNPLRLYTNQVVTVSSEKAFTTLEFYVVEDTKSTVFNLTDLLEPEDGLWDIDWEKECVTLSFEEAVTTTSFTLTEGQVRLFYIVTTFAE